MTGEDKSDKINTSNGHNKKLKAMSPRQNVAIWFVQHYMNGKVMY